ncbi:phage minor capsid protein [Bacillus sp. FJAT-50079]|uniref:phage minor capsid protein n=1 Tax=Bacillus sp. FJAT-50079 TaxID=2833577 RepID=UPI001BC9CC9E|nr:phage minor capsid protein [Bacillus sp. FJAT-50079]MBS4207453.1 hypothetical protein [Bacillus sp. FJAT-50079]
MAEFNNLDDLEYESLEEIDKETENLIIKYIIAYTLILKHLQQQINQGLNEKQSQRLLKKIQSHLKKLDADALKYVKNVFPSYYLLSLKNIDTVAVDLQGVKKIKGSKHAHKQALKQAQNDLYRDLAKRTQFMSVQAKRIIRENAKELLTAMIEDGTSQKKIKKELKEKLLKSGVSSFVDAGRKDWTIERYSDMLIRTKSRILYNQGTMNRLREYQENSDTYNENLDLIQISNHGASDWCSLYEDKVFSISGKSEIYPSIETLPNQGFPTLHPNCKHVFLPYISSLRGKGETVDKKYQSLSISELNKIEYQSRKKKA